MRYIATVNDQTFEIEILPDGRIEVNGTPHRVDIRSIDGSSLYSLLVDDRSYELFVEEEAGEYRVLLDGELHLTRVEDEWGRLLARVRQAPLTPPGKVSIQAPMPGLVVAVPVAVQQRIKAGQAVVILESMKMENELCAPCDGLVQTVRVNPGDIVKQGQVLVTIKSA